MKKIMLIGNTGCGKTTFCQAFYNMNIEYKKTQAIEYVNNAIDTPGEYIENRMLYRALSVTSADADVIVFVQDCTEEKCQFAPGLSNMFNGKPVLGIISKIDLAKDNEDILNAEEKLLLAGAEKVFLVSSMSGEGIQAVKEFIAEIS